MKITILNIIAFIVVILGICSLAYIPFAMKDRQKQIELRNQKNYEQGYLDACKDFYNGKLKFDLVENENGEKIWKKI